MSAAGVSRSADIAATGVLGLLFEEESVLSDEVSGTGTLSLDDPPVTVAFLSLTLPWMRAAIRISWGSTGINLAGKTQIAWWVKIASQLKY